MSHERARLHVRQWRALADNQLSPAAVRTAGRRAVRMMAMSLPRRCSLQGDGIANVDFALGALTRRLVTAEP